MTPPDAYTMSRAKAYAKRFSDTADASGIELHKALEVKLAEMFAEAIQELQDQNRLLQSELMRHGMSRD